MTTMFVLFTAFVAFSVLAAWMLMKPCKVRRAPILQQVAGAESSPAKLRRYAGRYSG